MSNGTSGVQILCFSQGLPIFDRSDSRRDFSAFFSGFSAVVDDSSFIFYSCDPVGGRLPRECVIMCISRLRTGVYFFAWG